ncbi:hypothetical protein D3C81_2106820 [compost metagenome]
MQGYLARHVSEGIAKGEIRVDVDPLAVATLILGAMRGMMMQFLLDPSVSDLAVLQKQLIAFVDSALGAPGPVV